MDILSVLHLLLWCIGVYAIIRFIKYFYDLRFYWKHRGVPCTLDIPFISGLGPVLFRNERVDELHKRFYAQCPNALYYGMLTAHMPTIVLRNPDLIRELCIKQFDSFTDHFGFISPELDPVFGNNLFSLKGQKWKCMRSTLSPSFTAAKMKILFEIVSKCAKDFSDFYLNHPEAAELINMRDAFTRYTSDLIATSAFGISVNSLSDRTNEFYVRGRDATNFNGVFRAIKFMSNILMPKVMNFLGFTFMTKSTDKFFKSLITDAVKMREQQGIVRADMLHLLMQARDSEGAKLSVNDIMAQAFIFFVAGFETTGTHLCTVSHELAMNPEIHRKLYEEIEESVSENGGQITYESISKMKYLDMVLKEALRKYPPVLETERICTKSFCLPPGEAGFSEYQLNVGTFIRIPIYGLHHDPKYYPDPEKFDPDRFDESRNEPINGGIYMPFGVGPRQCLASRFALMATKLLFSYILLNFVIRPTSKTYHPIVFAKGVTMDAENGFWNKFEQRKKVN